MPSVTIIGVGRVGGALDIAFRSSEYRVDSLIRRNDTIERVPSEVIIITTPDSEIGKVANVLVNKIERSSVILHTSGTLSSKELEVLTKIGCSTGSMHPLVSISSPEIGSKRFSGAYFCVEGDERAIKTARSIVMFLNGHSFDIPTENKALYHAAAVTACGHVTALVDLSISLMGRAGVDGELAARILQPLIQSTIDNLREQGTAAALTGTYARADADGLSRHLDAFEGKLSDEEIEIYLDLARRSLEMAKSNGIDADKIARVDSLISMAKSKLQ